jgi:hypothetical protein
MSLLESCTCGNYQCILLEMNESKKGVMLSNYNLKTLCYRS